MQRVIDDLAKAGFHNTVRLIEKRPQITSHDMQRVIKGLATAGFADPVKLIEKNPSLAGRNVQRVIEELTINGFTNPIGLVEKFSLIVNYDMQRVIKALKEAGFTNPVGLIERFPPVAGLSLTNIKRKIELIKTLNKQFGTDYNPHTVIESFPPYLSYSKPRLFFYLRIAAKFELDKKVYERFITKNPFLVFNYLYEAIPTDTSDLVKIASLIEELSKQEKTLRIANAKENLSQRIKTLEAQPESADRTFLLKLATHLVAQIK